MNAICGRPRLMRPIYTVDATRLSRCGDSKAENGNFSWFPLIKRTKWR